MFLIVNSLLKRADYSGSPRASTPTGYRMCFRVLRRFFRYFIFCQREGKPLPYGISPTYHLKFPVHFSLKNIVVLLPVSRSQYSLFFQLIRVPSSVPDSGTLVRPTPYSLIPNHSSLCIRNLFSVCQKLPLFFVLYLYLLVSVCVIKCEHTIK